MIGALARPYLLYGAAAVSLALGVTVLWQRGEVAQARQETAAARAEHAQQLQRLADKATVAAQAAQRAKEAQQAALTILDTYHYKRLTDALVDNDLLRRSPQRLRIAAVCPTRPAAGPDVPGTAPTSGMDDGSTVELAPAAGHAVWDIRAAMISDREKLAGLQAYVTAGCRTP